MQFSWSLIIFCFQEFHEFKYVTLDFTPFQTDIYIFVVDFD